LLNLRRGNDWIWPYHPHIRRSDNLFWLRLLLLLLCKRHSLIFLRSPVFVRIEDLRLHIILVALVHCLILGMPSRQRRSELACSRVATLLFVLLADLIRLYCLSALRASMQRNMGLLSIAIVDYRHWRSHHHLLISDRFLLIRGSHLLLLFALIILLLLLLLSALRLIPSFLHLMLLLNRHPEL